MELLPRRRREPRVPNCKAVFSSEPPCTKKRRDHQGVCTIKIVWSRQRTDPESNSCDWLKQEILRPSSAFSLSRMRRQSGATPACFWQWLRTRTLPGWPTFLPQKCQLGKGSLVEF